MYKKEYIGIIRIMNDQNIQIAKKHEFSRLLTNAREIILS